MIVATHRVLCVRMTLQTLVKQEREYSFRLLNTQKDLRELTTANGLTVGLLVLEYHQMVARLSHIREKHLVYALMLMTKAMFQATQIRSVVYDVVEVVGTLFGHKRYLGKKLARVWTLRH